MSLHIFLLVTLRDVSSEDSCALVKGLFQSFKFLLDVFGLHGDQGHCDTVSYFFLLLYSHAVSLRLRIPLMLGHYLLNTQFNRNNFFNFLFGKVLVPGYGKLFFLKLQVNFIYFGHHFKFLFDLGFY